MDFTVRNSAQWCALQILRYIGVTSLTPKPDTGGDPDDNRTYLAEGDLDGVASIMTATLQDIAADGPAALSEIPFGRSLHAPATVVLNVTQGSAATQLVSGWQDWMNGCAVVIAGDGFVNEWANRTGLLRRPFLGPSASNVTATVFCTAIELEQDIRTVLEPVGVPGCPHLLACGDRAQYEALSGCHFLSSAVRSGWPHAYIVETRYDETLDYLPTFLRVAPAPQGPLPLTFKAKVNPPVINVEDLGDSTTDPGVMLPIPGRWLESIFLPYCFQRFTGSPLFKNDGAKPEIARQFTEAKKRIAAFKPQIARQSGAQAFRP